MNINRKLLVPFLIFMILVPTLNIPIPTVIASQNEEDPTQNGFIASIEYNSTAFWAKVKQNVKWRLEWFNGVEWVEKNQDLSIIRGYPKPRECKFTLVFDASESGDYRLTMGIDKALRKYLHKEGSWSYTLEFEDMKLLFDWSDLKEISGLQLSHGVQDNWFWFRIRRDNIPRGAHVELDPVLIDLDKPGDHGSSAQYGNVFVCMVWDSVDRWQIYVSLDYAVTWNWYSDLDIIEYDNDPLVRVNSTGYFHIVYAIAGEDDILVHKDYYVPTDSLSARHTIEPAFDIGLDGAYDFDIDSSDILHVAYERNQGEVKYRNSTTSGILWSGAISVNPGVNANARLLLLIDPDDVLNILYFEGFDFLDVYYTYSTDYGATWSAPVDTYDGVIQYTSLDATLVGPYIAAVLSKYNGATITYLNNIFGVWDHSVIVTNVIPDYSGPAIEWLRTGELFVLFFNDTIGPRGHLYIMNSTDYITFSTPELLYEGYIDCGGGAADEISRGRVHAIENYPFFSFDFYFERYNTDTTDWDAWYERIESELFDQDAGISNMEGCGDWVFEGRTQYIFYVNISLVGVVGSEISAGLGFYDFANNWYSFYYDNDTGRVTLVTPYDGVSAGLESVQTGDHWVYIEFSVMFNSPVVDSTNVSLYVRWFIPVAGDSGWHVINADYFNIYNLGGYVSTLAIGPSGRYAGGDVFELYASRGGRVRSNLTYRNLQHFGFLFEMSFPTWDDFGPGSFGYVEYGLDFCIDHTWYQGLVVRLEPWNMGVDATNAWMEYYVSFYYRGSFVGDLPVNIIALWEAGTAFTTEKQVSKIWVDLWFNKMNASTVMGASVNSYWYGMRKDITWWDPFTWFSDWTPLMTNYTRASWFQDIELDDGVHSCTEITMMKAWCEIYHPDLEHDDFNFSAISYDVFNVEIQDGSMRGIDTPIFTDTKIFDKANQGFFAALTAGIISGIERLSEVSWTTIMAAWSYMIPFIDVIPGFFGFHNFLDTMTQLGYGFFNFIFTILTENYLFQMISQIFTVVTSTMGHILLWLGRIISTFDQIFTIVWAILDGSYTGVGAIIDVWNLFNWDGWVDAVPIFMIIAWMSSIDDRARKAGGGWMTFFIGDLRMITWLMAFFIDVSTRIINTFVNISASLINIIRG